jgi:flagellar motor switch protein FliM
MPDVLGQHEVEALLSALNPTTTPSGFETKRDWSLDGGQMAIYDFKRPERVGKDQIRALQTLHDSFARNLGSAISGMLRTIAEVKLISVDQVTYSEFIFSLENPTCFNLIKAAPLDGHIILDINPSIIFPILDRLLGGGQGRVSAPHRALTEIELRLVGRLTSLAMATLRTAWATILALDLQIVQVESNAQLVQIVPPTEVVVLLSFEITIGDARGMMNLCIPFNALEPVVGKLSSNTWFSYTRREVSKENTDFLSQRLQGSMVELVVYLAETDLTASELANLQIGDIITTPKDANTPLLVSVAGAPKFHAHAGACKGHKAIRIGEFVPPTARINQ